MFDLRQLKTQKKLVVRATVIRVRNTSLMILNCLEKKSLPPALAAKLFGKLDFLNQSLLGKVGRVGLLPIKARQYERSTEMTSELVTALWWILQLLHSCPPRDMPVSRNRKPILIYTDGSSDPKRDPQHCVGVVLVVPGVEKMLYAHAAVPT